MSEKEKIKKLKQCFQDVVWMSIRYANGRQTYAPDMVRDAIKNFQSIFPGWQPKSDPTINPPEDGNKGDYLWDLFNNDAKRTI